MERADWWLNLHGLVEKPVTLDWTQFMALEQFANTSEFHRVTTWSQFDMEFSGVDGDEEAFDDDEFAEDFDDEMDEVFEAEDEDEFEAGKSQVGFAAPAGPAARSIEAPWGAAVTAGVAIGSAFSAVGAFAGFELVRTMWMWFQPGGGESSFLLFIGGFFG